MLFKFFKCISFPISTPIGEPYPKCGSKDTYAGRDGKYCANCKHLWYFCLYITKTNRLKSGS